MGQQSFAFSNESALHRWTRFAYRKQGRFSAAKWFANKLIEDRPVMSSIRVRTWAGVVAIAACWAGFASSPGHAEASWLDDPMVEASTQPQPPDFDQIVDDVHERWEETPPLARKRLALLTEAERAPFRLATSFAPSRSVRDTDDSLASRSIASQVGYPLRIYADGILLGTTSLQYTRLSTEAVLPRSGISVPDELWDVRAGMFFTRELASGWKVGGLFNFGSASDEPFHSPDELTLTSLGFLSVPVRNRDAWNFSLFYSPTSQLAFPIPGIAYLWRPNDELEAQIGLPASLTYAPNDSFSFRARYTPVTDVFVEARQAVVADWSVFARYQIINESYFLAGRADREERFFQFEQQAGVGLAHTLPAGFSFELGAAYLFDRRFFHDSDFDLQSDDMIQVDPTVSYSFQLIWNR
jgi:hypothetical protein